MVLKPHNYLHAFLQLAYHIHAQLPHNTCKPVYMAYDNSDVVNWENMEKCTYNTVRTCSENSIEIVQEQYENTALEKLKKKGGEGGNIQTNNKADSLLVSKDKVEIGSVFESIKTKNFTKYNIE